MIRRRQAAFTLVELLVVTTVIVMLMALLAPALDKAMYHAEQAVCGSRLKGVSTASFMYAQDHKRHYPSRPIHYAWDALILRHPNFDPQYPANDNAPKAPWDLRPLFMPYMSLDQFVDPLAGQIKLDDANNQKVGGATGVRGDVHIYSNYRIYTGWAPDQTPIGIRNRRLARVGDRWTFSERLHLTEPIDRSFGILATDLDNTWGGAWATSSHYDVVHNTFNFRRFQAEDSSPDDVYNPVLGGKFVTTFSYWENRSYAPGQVKGDYNYAYTDGSVRRENHVQYDDERMAKVIETSWNEYTQGRYGQLPKSGG